MPAWLGILTLGSLWQNFLLLEHNAHTIPTEIHIDVMYVLSDNMLVHNVTALVLEEVKPN